MIINNLIDAIILVVKDFNSLTSLNNLSKKEEEEEDSNRQADHPQKIYPEDHV